MGLDFIQKTNNQFVRLENKNRSEILDNPDLFHQRPIKHRITLFGNLSETCSEIGMDHIPGTLLKVAKGWAVIDHSKILIGYLTPESAREVIAEGGPEATAYPCEIMSSPAPGAFKIAIGSRDSDSRKD